MLACAKKFSPTIRRAPRWVWAVPVVLWLSVIPFVGETRFRMPIEPFLVLLAAVALSGRQRLREESTWAASSKADSRRM